MKKVIVLILAVLFLGTVGMAKTDYFDAIYIEGALTLTGTSAISFVGLTFALDFSSTIVFDGATSVRNISAGFVSLEGPASRFGANATEYISIAVTASTGDTAITHTGSNKAVSWTASGGFTFAGGITNIGTISAGAWQGTVVAHEYGGLEADVNAYDGLVRITGGSTSAVAVTANVLTFLDSADFAAMVTNLSLTIGTNTQAWDADLDTWATLTPTADAQTLVESTNFLSMTQDLSVEIGVDVLAYDAGLSNLAGIAMIADRFYYTSADNTHVAAPVTVFARTILDDTAAGNVCTTIGLGTGDSPTFTGLTLSGKVVQGGAYGATAIALDGTDPDQVFQSHGAISTDVVAGPYAAVLCSLTNTSSLANDVSTFGSWSELYFTGDLTIEWANHAAEWSNIELVDGGSGALTFDAKGAQPAYDATWIAGHAITFKSSDGFALGANRLGAGLFIQSMITSGYSQDPAAEFAAILINANTLTGSYYEPWPIGLQFMHDSVDVDIELTSGQLIDASTAGVASVAGDSAVEYVAGLMRTVITVDSTSAGDDIDLENKDDGGGTLLYTFPVGHIRILGVVADLTTTSSAEIHQATFPMSIGTTAAADAEATLTGTEADLCASTAISFDGAQATDLPPVSAADMTYDGTSSAVVVYLNAAVLNANINGAATVKSTGTVTIHWALLGDY